MISQEIEDGVYDSIAKAIEENNDSKLSEFENTLIAMLSSTVAARIRLGGAVRWRRYA